MAEILPGSNPQSYKPKVPDNFVPVTLTSGNGKEYEIMVPEGSEDDARSQAESGKMSVTGGPPSFEIYWEVGKEWRETSEDLAPELGSLDTKLGVASFQGTYFWTCLQSLGATKL